MADDAFTKPEVPDAFRDLMKISIEQTKRAFETFAATSEKAWKTFETSSQTAGSGLRSDQLEEIRDLAAQVIQDSTPPGMPGGKP